MAPSSQRVEAPGVVREGDGQLSRGGMGGGGREKSSAASGAPSTARPASQTPFCLPQVSVCTTLTAQQCQKATEYAVLSPRSGLPGDRKRRPHSTSHHYGVREPGFSTPRCCHLFSSLLGHSHPDRVLQGPLCPPRPQAPAFSVCVERLRVSHTFSLWAAWQHSDS